MSATIQIDEQNGPSAGPTLTQNISNSNMGSLDAPNLDSVINFMAPGAYTFEKWQKIHCINLNGLSKINNFKVWRVGALGGAAVHKTNLQNPPVNTAYATPINNVSSVCTQVFPTSVPANTNIGVGGTTNGLTVPGSTDFIVDQIKVDPADTSGSLSTKYYQWDEIA